MSPGLGLDYLEEARSTLDSYVEHLVEVGGEESSSLLAESVAFSLLSIADSLASIAAGLPRPPD